MPVHWQEFSLIPRDLLAQQATTPIERSCVNGGPVDLSGSCAAVNLIAPQVTSSATPPKVGTVLSSDRGTWRVARAPLSFQRQWLRDGAPIAGATAIQYIVRAADRGHRLSVRVDAAATGIVPGSATSAEVQVPSTDDSVAPSPSSTPSGGPPVTVPPQRMRPTLTVRLISKHGPRLRVRVQGSMGTATGTVVVAGPRRWKRDQRLRGGTLAVRIPKAVATTRGRLTVRYRGDSHYLPTKRVVRIRPANH
jgi:hypothetical protein